MCGIAGIFNLDGMPVSPVALRKMTDAVAHRGPDGEGFFIDSFLGLGHRRLAIIDLSPAGHQPRVSSCGNFAITFNGEIYNFRELRKTLEALGHAFTSRTDTEVALHAYIQWGPTCVERFSGMFAFASGTRRAPPSSSPATVTVSETLSTTPSPETPSSSARSRSHPRQNSTVARELDLEALLEYFTFRTSSPNKTLLKGIRLFPQGAEPLLPSAPHRALKIDRYWDFDFREPETVRTEDEYIEELDFLFRQAVKRQLVSDVDVRRLPQRRHGLRQHHRRRRQGTALHEDLHLRLRPQLRLRPRTCLRRARKGPNMSYLFKTEHYEMVLKASDMERVMPASHGTSKSRVGQSYPTSPPSSPPVRQGRPLRRGRRTLRRATQRYYRAAVCTNFDDYIDRYYRYWQRLASNSTLKRSSPVWPYRCEHVWTRDIFKSVFERRDPAPAPRGVSTTPSTSRPKPSFTAFVVEDKLSSAHALETRAPFLDNDLVDFAVRLPVRMKLRTLDEVVRIDENEPGSKQAKYFQKTNDGKSLLRKVMRRHIPDQITSAQKQGFSAPDASWFKGESMEYVRRTLMGENAKLFEYMDKGVLRSLVDEHLGGVQNRRLLVWSLLNVNTWLEVLDNV